MKKKIINVLLLAVIFYALSMSFVSPPKAEAFIPWGILLDMLDICCNQIRACCMNNCYPFLSPTTTDEYEGCMESCEIDFQTVCPYGGTGL